ncbi:MAG: hypothetical protein DCF15_07725 [Phormidesmis priestleyi]|uniref:Uncharacterized protein n=1 Tax=Phormidesmis priestleyi TaxID=268141 RepID=A0A2W4ZFL8_9CYAN|nr:MAG: hypothetical protein DCF15_07725 [Phormidesmis priestleyi]
MPLKLIDQALTALISLLIYGSEFWFTLAFTLYVATHQHANEKLEKALPAAKTPILEKDISIPVQTFIPVQTIVVSEKAPSTKVFSEKFIPSDLSLKAASPKVRAPKSLSAKISATKISSAKVFSVTTVAQPIICEPVNWKKWKAADLRKASIAKVCGVRMTPIGSRRKLTKADLIAQYEQTLKRLTRSPIASSASLKNSQSA